MQQPLGDLVKQLFGAEQMDVRRLTAIGAEMAGFRHDQTGGVLNKPASRSPIGSFRWRYRSRAL